MGCQENKSKRAEENKLGKKSMYPQMFSVPGKRTKHARSEKKFPTLGKKKKKNAFELVGTWWFLVVD